MEYSLMKSVWVLAILCLGLVSANAMGQQQSHGSLIGSPPPQYRPTVSPYLNLLNQGANEDGTFRSYAVYQTLVRPQLAQRETDLSSQAGMARPSQGFPRVPAQANVPFATRPNRTGHGAGFMSFSHYYTYPQVR